MIQYGLISQTDARTLEKTIDLIAEEIKLRDEIFAFVTEIGLFDCGTAVGIYKYLKENNIKINYIGIDNEKDKPINAPDWMNYINGNSNEVYNQLEDNSQHLCFVDGCHCFAHVVSDFFCYAPKVKVGGYFAFHDTGRHIKPFKDFQHGDKNNPDAYISCRKSLNAIGLYNNSLPNWGLIFDDADPLDEAGGISVFKRLL
jgi:hypothetical protein